MNRIVFQPRRERLIQARNCLIRARDRLVRARDRLIRAATVREWLRRDPNVTGSNHSLTVAARNGYVILKQYTNVGPPPPA